MEDPIVMNQEGRKVSTDEKSEEGRARKIYFNENAEVIQKKDDENTDDVTKNTKDVKGTRQGKDESTSRCQCYKHFVKS